MLRRLLVVAAAIAVCCGARGGEDGGNGANGGRSGRTVAGYRLPVSFLVSCPVISRLGLEGDQLEKVRRLETAAHGRIEAVAKTAVGDAKKRGDYYRKRRAMLEELRVEIVGLLTGEQKGRYEAGQAIMEKYEAKIGQALKDYLRARREAGRDEAAVSEVRKAYYDTKKPLVAERNRLLDEKVGRRGRPAAKAAAGR
ncbi:MAG: hypothetical protein ACYTGB_02880 [Planctomycetota bacterium]